MSAAATSSGAPDVRSPGGLATVRRLFGYTRPYARMRGLLLLLVVARSVQLPLVTWIIAKVISGPVADHSPRGTVAAVLGFVVLTGLTDFCFVFRMRLALMLGEQVVQDLRREIFAHLLRLPLSFFRKTPAGQLIGRLTSDVDAVRVGVQDVAFITLVQAGHLVVCSALMIYFDWQLFLIIAALGPMMWFLVRHFRSRLSDAYRAQQESFSRVTSLLTESVNGMRVIQAFARQRLSAERFGNLVYDHAAYNMDAARHSAPFQPLLELFSQLFLAALLVVGGQKVLGHVVPLDTLIQFLFLSAAVFSAIPHLGNQYNQALTAIAGAERVFTLLDTPPDWQDGPTAVPLQPIAGRIELRDVGFEYAPGRPVLDGVSFVAEPGQTVALTGATGSGKTTLANLVAKLYLPTRGELLIDGREIRAISSASLHAQLACVTQDNFLFSATVLDNIRMARPEATEQQVRAAAEALGVLDIIESLNDGFATMVGERGAGLSLGQRQVICFVRAMLADPRILILDEATSSVDLLTEARIHEALLRLLAGRTTIIIAHRLSTLRHADQILVLERGRIVERGAHTELLAQNGRYAALHRRFEGGTT